MITTTHLSSTQRHLHRYTQCLLSNITNRKTLVLPFKVYSISHFQTSNSTNSLISSSTRGARLHHSTRNNRRQRKSHHFFSSSSKRCRVPNGRPLHLDSRRLLVAKLGRLNRRSLIAKPNRYTVHWECRGS